MNRDDTVPGEDGDEVTTTSVDTTTRDENTRIKNETGDPSVLGVEGEGWDGHDDGRMGTYGGRHGCPDTIGGRWSDGDVLRVVVTHVFLEKTITWEGVPGPFQTYWKVVPPRSRKEEAQGLSFRIRSRNLSPSSLFDRFQSRRENKDVTVPLLVHVGPRPTEQERVS